MNVNSFQVIPLSFTHPYSSTICSPFFAYTVPLSLVHKRTSSILESNTIPMFQSTLIMWLAPLLQVYSELDADVPLILFLSDVFFFLLFIPLKVLRTLFCQSLVLSLPTIIETWLLSISCPPSHKHCQSQFWTIDVPGPQSFTN